jgi:hypothetical protein
MGFSARITTQERVSGPSSQIGEDLLQLREDLTDRVGDQGELSSAVVV